MKSCWKSHKLFAAFALAICLLFTTGESQAWHGWHHRGHHGWHHGWHHHWHHGGYWHPWHRWHWRHHWW